VRTPRPPRRSRRGSRVDRAAHAPRHPLIRFQRRRFASRGPSPSAASGGPRGAAIWSPPCAAPKKLRRRLPRRLPRRGAGHDRGDRSKPAPPPKFTSRIGGSAGRAACLAVVATATAYRWTVVSPRGSSLSVMLRAHDVLATPRASPGQALWAGPGRHESQRPRAGQRRSRRT
jgi:hypothetical protein